MFVFIRRKHGANIYQSQELSENCGNTSSSSNAHAFKNAASYYEDTCSEVKDNNSLDRQKNMHFMLQSEDKVQPKIILKQSSFSSGNLN